MVSSVLDSDQWAAILADGLNARTIFTSIPGSAGLRWTVFSKGPLRAGYLRFPVGADDDIGGLVDTVGEHLSTLRDHGIHLAQMGLRCRLPEVPYGRFHSAMLPETSIDDLKGWSDARMHRATRSKVRRSLRLGMGIRDAQPNDGAAVHALYSESVRRKGGTTKYTRAYFDALCNAASKNAWLSLGVARDCNERILAFIAVLHDPSHSYYLHGGYSSAGAPWRPGYAMMHWAIRRSIEFGSARFNMLPSPRGQMDLVRYKESFGGTTSIRHHYRVPINLTGHLLDLALRIPTSLNRWFRS